MPPIVRQTPCPIRHDPALELSPPADRILAIGTAQRTPVSRYPSRVGSIFESHGPVNPPTTMRGYKRDESVLKVSRLIGWARESDAEGDLSEPRTN